MKKIKEHNFTMHPGDHLKGVVRVAAFGGLFLSLIGTCVIWTGTDAFNCSAIIWQSSLEVNLVAFILTWAIYFPFRNTDRLLGHGLISILMLVSLFWLFGFSMFYFYFLFSPISTLARFSVLTGFTGMLFYRIYIINDDIKEAFQMDKQLFCRMYVDEGTCITYSQYSYSFLQEARKDRNPFKSIHAYVAIAIAPFVLVLNSLLAPVVGEGHGVFMISAFLTAPILIWGTDMFVQTIVTTIYYPIKLERQSGKPVLTKGW
jgi:hypothetical protein